MADLDAVGTTLLKAAGTLLAEEGPAALTVRRIASCAGVSTMNVYSRFGGKDGVVEHLFCDGFRRLGESMSARRDTHNPVADLRACGRAYRKWAIDNPTLYSVMFDSMVPELIPGRQATTQANSTLVLLAAKIERAMKANALRRANPLQTAGLVWATCHGAVSLELKSAASADIDWPRTYENALEMIIKGLS